VPSIRVDYSTSRWRSLDDLDARATALFVRTDDL